jgi:mRNA-degrading endonuclease HigB of HigAB toxin-antitoxin module
VLNVNKIIKDKFKTKFIVPNRVQSFLLNYEIKKLLDKAINIKNKKYRRVIYLNSNISTPIIINTMTFIGEEYDKLTFTYHLIESRLPEEEISPIENLNRIKI